MSLAEMIARSLGEEDEAQPRMSHIGQVARLQEFAAVYATGNPFRIGDLVTPRKGGNIRNSGEPHIVVEVREAEPYFEGSCTSVSFGKRLTIRVAQIVNEVGAVCFWNEHHEYEPYLGDGSRPGDL